MIFLAKSINNTFALSIVICCIISCNNQPVLSHLLNTKMNLIFKGTYETNNPHEWSEIYQNDSVELQASPINQPVNINDFKFFFDFASIALTTVTKKTSETQEDDWSFFFRNRMVLCASHTLPDGTPLQTCQNTNGIKSLTNFFEEGLQLKSDDVGEATYQMLGLNPRNMVTSPSFSYNTSNQPIDNTTTFDNKIIQGDGILQYYHYHLDDDAQEQNSRLLPIIDKNLNLNIDSGERPYTLEVRIFLKNLMMKHVLLNPAQRSRRVFIGPSDWLTNHRFDDDIDPKDQSIQNYFRLGGTILMKVRKYVNDNRGHLAIKRMGSVCLGGRGQTNGLSYFAILPKGEKFEITKLPLAATKYQNSNERINNVPPANYDIYITYDRMINTDSGMINGKDGFPESFRLCMSSINVPANSTVDVDISSCACP